MRKTLLMVAIMGLSSCSLFESSKKPIVKKASEIAKELSVKHLGCSTGDAVFTSVEAQVKKALKVKSKGLKSISGTLCYLAVKPVVSEVLGLGNGKLPDSWKADGCSLDGFAGGAEELANKLCGKL